ncbi:FF domain protein [Niveomyces insectorum RCEF 264]|uniref:FF domain protein n=1 Tax=Niveomyces insectorum RCEF 264 TaxID=1081102 RepID=A0A162IH95_9HYPO|nr:FF domain protein [Niveomyces insectorum RCEF 264]
MAQKWNTSFGDSKTNEHDHAGDLASSTTHTSSHGHRLNGDAITDTQFNNDTAYSGSEYYGSEVAEQSEGEQLEGDDNPPKRRKTDNFNGGPMEFSEADIAFQLQAAAVDFNESHSHVDEDDAVESPELSNEEAWELFKSLFDYHHINPYSSWEKLVEEGRIIDDERYAVLGTMKSRKTAFEEWSKAKIKELKAKKVDEEKIDPRVAYFSFLQSKATPKLYWPEFKRKYRKEAVMKDTSITERDKERWFRDYISRLKLPLSTLKSDLVKLLESIPTSKLNNQTVMSELPSDLLADIRYVSLDARLRDQLIETYIQTAGPPPA